MNATLRPWLSLDGPLMLVFGRGTWFSSGILLLVLFGGFGLTALLEPSQNARVLIHLVETGFAVGVWWLLIGSRILAIRLPLEQSATPRAGAPMAASLLLAWTATVLLPAVFLGCVDHDFNVALATLTLAASLPICWVSLPHILSFTVLFLPFLAWLLPKLSHPLDITLFIATSSIWLAVACTCFIISALWFAWFHFGVPQSVWLRPLGVNLLQQANAGMNEQIRRNLTDSVSLQRWAISPTHMVFRHSPKAALRFALGPGIEIGGIRGAVRSQSILVLLCAFCLWLALHDPGNEANATLALFAPIWFLIGFTLSPMWRLWTLRRIPSLGLYELALLPGLPSGRERTTCGLDALVHALTVHLLVGWLILCVYGALLHAPNAYYLGLIYIVCTNLMLLACNAALIFLWRNMPGIVLMLNALICMAAFSFWMFSMVATDTPSWINPAIMSGLVIASIAALAWLRSRIKRLPHPWLAE